MGFYQCPNCKKIWQYRIEKCPDCFQNLKKLESKNLKVIGVSRVNIPTFLHPQIPYFVLLLEDENKNRFVFKSEKEYKIGDFFELEKAKSKEAVAIWRIKYDFKEAIEKTLELLGDFDFENKKILILPTLETPVHPHLRENTSPEFLRAVLEFLLERGVKEKNIKIVNQSFNQFEIGACAFKSQLLFVAQSFSVIPKDLAQGEFLKKGKFEITAEVFDSDIILNLPILKTTTTQSLDNILKLLKKENFLSLEYLSSKEEILKEIFQFLPPVLTIAEANYIKRENRTICALYLVFSSFNPFNLERVFYEVIKKEPPKIIKEIEIEKIEILGRKIKEVQLEVETLP